MRSLLDTYTKTGIVSPLHPDLTTILATGLSTSPDTENLYDLLATVHDHSLAQTQVAALPTDLNQSDIEGVKHILLLSTFINVAAMRIVSQAKPDGWDIGDPAEAAQLVRTSANSIFQVLSQSMAGFFTLSSNTVQSMTKCMLAADLHLEFLGDLFKDFDFPAKSLKELDGIMTNVVKQLGDIKLGFNSSYETLDHLLFTFYLEEVGGTEYKVPKLRVFFLHIDQSSWEASILKSTIEKFEFHMNYNDMIFDMTWQPQPGEVEHLQALLSEWTGREINDLLHKLAPSTVRF